MAKMPQFRKRPECDYVEISYDWKTWEPMVQVPEEVAPGVWSEQPAPEPNLGPAVWDLVLADIATRDKVGTERYGTRLQPNNGRDALRDAYEEALDLVVYLRQAIYERDAK